MEKKIDLMLSELQKLNERVITIENDVSNIKNDVSNIKSEQQQIKQAVMETNESMKQLNAIQDSQQRIIELLSARSLEQESELRDLKRVK